MIFETFKGKHFNSISVEHLKERFGLSHSEYTICIEYSGNLFAHAGFDTLEKCQQQAKKFVKRYNTSVKIYYFERPTADEWYQEFIEDIYCPSATLQDINNHQVAKDKNKKIEHDNSIEFSTQKYLEFLKSC